MQFYETESGAEKKNCSKDSSGMQDASMRVTVNRSCISERPIERLTETSRETLFETRSAAPSHLIKRVSRDNTYPRLSDNERNNLLL